MSELDEEVGPRYDSLGVASAQRLQWLSREADFARSSLQAVSAAQMRLRLASVSTGGLVASIVFSLFFTQERNVQPLLNQQSTVIGALALALSLVYAILGLIYVNLSGQRHSLVSYLRDQVPYYLRSLDPRANECKNYLQYEAEKAKGSWNIKISGIVWSIQFVCIFILPCILPLTVWPLLLHFPITSLISMSTVRELPYSTEPYMSWIYILTVFVVTVILLSLWIQRCYYRPDPEVWKWAEHRLPRKLVSWWLSWWKKCKPYAPIAALGFWVMFGWCYAEPGTVDFRETQSYFPVS